MTYTWSYLFSFDYICGVHIKCKFANCKYHKHIKSEIKYYKCDIQKKTLVFERCDWAPEHAYTKGMCNEGEQFDSKHEWLINNQHSKQSRIKQCDVEISHY